MYSTFFCTPEKLQPQAEIFFHLFNFSITLLVFIVNCKTWIKISVCIVFNLYSRYKFNQQTPHFLHLPQKSMNSFNNRGENDSAPLGTINPLKPKFSNCPQKIGFYSTMYLKFIYLNIIYLSWYLDNDGLDPSVHR